jgi:hypothetical protein
MPQRLGHRLVSVMPFDIFTLRVSLREAGSSDGSNGQASMLSNLADRVSETKVFRDPLWECCQGSWPSETVHFVF